MKRVLILSYLFLSAFLHGQDNFDRVYKITSDDTPFLNTYESVFDTSGFYWVGTNNGLYRYSSYRDFDLTYKDTIVGKAVYGMEIDAYGTIWFVNNVGVLYFIKDNIPQRFSIPGDDIVQVIHFQNNKKEIIIYCPSKVYILDVKSQTLTYICAYPSDDLQIAFTDRIVDNVLYSITKNKRAKNISGIKYVNLFDRLKNEAAKKGLTVDFESNYFSKLIRSYTGSLIFIQLHIEDHHIFCFDTKSKTFIDLPEQVSQIKELFSINIATKDLYSFNTRNGSYLFNPKQGKLELIPQTKGKGTNNIKIKNGQIWCNTRTDGIFLFNQKGIKLISPEPYFVLKILDNQDLVASKSNNVSLFRKDTLVKTLQIPGTNYSINESKHSVVLRNGGEGDFEVDKKSFSKIKKLRARGLNRFTIREDTITLTYTGLKLNDKIFNKSRYYNYVISKDSTIVYLANNEGVDKLNIITRELEIMDEGFICSSLNIDSKNRLWAAAASGGGLRVYNNEERLYNFPNEELFKGKTCRTILIDSNKLWVATNKGLINFDPESRMHKIYSRTEGLLNTNILRIAKNDNYLYISTMKGLYCLDLNEQTDQNSFTPNCYIQSIKIWDAEKKIKNSYELNDDENNLFIEFLTDAYYILGDYEFYYRMIGIDSSWTTTSSQENYARFPQLSPGKYTFEVYSSLDDNRIKSDIKKINFTIDHPLRQKLWFQILIAILTLTGLFWLVNYIQREKLSKVKQNLESEKMRSLLQQMNPHFIYNTLNSIQYFIFNDKRYEAGKYLSIFSDLMRKNFEFSESEYIPLKEEIDHIKNYLGMEKIRFEDQLDIQIDIEENLKSNSIHIPPFLIQPILENAIKHGLRSSVNNRKLTISFHKRAPYLKVTITDNGIGRVAAGNRKKNINKPYSSNINIQKRIELLNRLEKNKPNPISFEIEDLYNQNNSSDGTKVTFKFPLL